jgi:hypothetical protein
MGSQKEPRMVVLHCNCRTYGNAYLITFKVGPLHARTHAHTCTCSVDPAIVGSTGGRLFFRIFRSWTFAPDVPLRQIFRVGTAKSQLEQDPDSTVVG